jgi:hypothetical protein
VTRRARNRAPAHLSPRVRTLCGAIVLRSARLRAEDGAQRPRKGRGVGGGEARETGTSTTNGAATREPRTGRRCGLGAMIVASPPRANRPGRSRAVGLRLRKVWQQRGGGLSCASALAVLVDPLRTRGAHGPARPHTRGSYRAVVRSADRIRSAPTREACRTRLEDRARRGHRLLLPARLDSAWATR